MHEATLLILVDVSGDIHISYSSVSMSVLARIESDNIVILTANLNKMIKPNLYIYIYIYVYISHTHTQSWPQISAPSFKYDQKRL